MTTAIVAVVIAGLAAAAIQRSVVAGRYRADAAAYRIRSESYRAEIVRLKHDYQRMQAATESALELAETAVASGDTRRALAALARMQAHEPRLYDQKTDDMLADAAAAATTAANGHDRLRGRRGLLGRLARGSDRTVGVPRSDLDGEG